MKLNSLFLGLAVVAAMTACGNSQNENRNEHHDENLVDSIPPPRYDTPVDTNSMNVDTISDVIPPTPPPAGTTN